MLTIAQLERIEAAVADGRLPDPEDLVALAHDHGPRTWVPTSERSRVHGTLVRMAVVIADDVRGYTMATAKGRVGVAALGEASCEAPTEWFDMVGFNRQTDEVRNIVASPRRLSTEVDLFITVRRFKDLGENEQLVWRAVCWADDGSLRMRPVVERVPQGERPWVHVPLPDHTPSLPRWLFHVPYQAAMTDGLMRGAMRRLTQSLGDADDAVCTAHPSWHAWSEGERVHWVIAEPNKAPRSGVLAIGEPVVALAAWPGGRGRQRLIIGCAGGRVVGPVDLSKGSTPPNRELLGTTANVIGALRWHDHEELLVVSQDRHLTRFRRIERARVAKAWDAAAAIASRDPGDNGAAWVAWALDTRDARLREARVLLWTRVACTLGGNAHAALCAQMRASATEFPGVAMGRELAAALAEHRDNPDLHRRGLQLYLAGGPPLREQVDLLRPHTSDPTLGERMQWTYWRLATDPGVDPWDRSLANDSLTTSSWLHARSFHNTGGRFIGAITCGQEALGVLAAGRGLSQFPITSDPYELSRALGPQRQEGSEVTMQLRWVRTLHSGGERFGVVFGGDGEEPLAVLPGESGLVTEGLGRDARRHSIGAVVLGEPGSDELRLGVAWRHGPRAVLDEVTLSREGTRWRVARGRAIALPPSASLLDALPSAHGHALIAVVTNTREVTLHRYEPDQEALAPMRTVTVDARATALRFVRGGHGEGDLLVVGTQGGFVWAFDVGTGRARWVQSTGEAVTTMDVEGSGAHARILLGAAPSTILLLDANGILRWRHDIAARPAGVSFTTPRNRRSKAIAVIDARGTASIYVEPTRERWEAKILTEDAPTITPRLAAVRFASRGFVGPVPPEVATDAAARRIACGRLAELAATLPAWEETVDRLAPHGRDLAAMARELPTNTPIGRWGALWERTLHLTVDREEAVAELLRALHRRRAPASFLQDRMAELGLSWPTWSDATWPAYAAGVAWASAIVTEPGATELDVVERLHKLAPMVAAAVRHAVGDAHIADLLDALAAAATSKKLDRTERDALESAAALVARRSPRQNLAPGLAAALALIRESTWAHAEALVAAAKHTGGDGPLASVLRQLPARLPGGDVPQHTQRLDQQLRWCARVTALRLGADRTPGRFGPWERLAATLSAALEVAWRQAVMDRLAALVPLSRPWVEAQIIQDLGGEIDVEIELTHDGEVDLEPLEVEVHYVHETTETPFWHASGLQLRKGDPPIRVRRHIAVSSDDGVLALRVRSAVAGTNVDTTTWNVPRPGLVDEEDGPAPLLTAIPTLWDALLARVDSMESGVWLLVVDGPLGAGRVARALARRDGTDLLHLDRLGDSIGTVRSEFARHTAAHTKSSGMILVYPGAQATRRWLDAADASARDAFLDILARHDRRGGQPSFAVVVDSHLAVRLQLEFARRDLPAVSVLRAHEITDREDSTLATEVGARLGSGHESGVAALRASCGDLRVLEAVARGEEAQQARLRWARAELAALEPHDLAVLVGIVDARTRIAVHDAEGHIAAEDVRLPLGPRIKVLASRGMPIANTLRLRNVRKHILVRGLIGDSTRHFEPRRARLLSLVGFHRAHVERLEALGLVTVSPLGAAEVRTDIANVIREVGVDERPIDEVIAELGGENAWWRAIRLADLSSIKSADLPAARASRAPMLRAVGRMWREGSVPAAAASALCQAWTGAPPIQTESEAWGSSAGVRAEVRVPPGARHRAAYLHFVPADAAKPERRSRADADLHVFIGKPASQWTGEGVALGEVEVRDLLRASDPRRAFWATVRAQGDLERLSPFTHAGALPVGSPLFVGRESIRAEVAQWLTARSFLILGARQVGKTSLLHQLFHEASARQDVYPVLVDAQGCDTPERLYHELEPALQARGLSSEPNADAALKALRLHARKRGRRLVVFINEIDGLLTRSPDFLQRMRARHEAGEIRFVLVGYATVRWSLDDLNGPLYHFTTGDLGRAYFLGSLGTTETRALLAWLTREPLALAWEEGHQEHGERLLAARAYDIPWIVQDLCHALVCHMANARRGVITLDDVRQVVGRAPEMLRRLEEFEHGMAMGAAPGSGGWNAANAGGRFVVMLLARQLYFAWGPHPDVDELRALEPRARAFTAEDLRYLCDEGLLQLPLDAEEVERVSRWLRAVDVDRYLKALSLSLMVEPLPDATGEPLWWFQGHVYPAELRRAELAGKTIDDRVLERCQQLLYHL